MVKQKACLNCKLIYEGEECPNCHSKDSSENFKGKIVIEDAEHSEIAKKLKIQKKGIYAIKTK